MLDTVLLSGQPLDRLRQAARASTLIALPYAHRLQGDLLATGRRVVLTNLPIGLHGTSAWLAQVGEALGAPAPRVREVIRRLSGHAHQGVSMLLERARGGRSAVFGELPLAVGLCDVAESLGLAPRLVGLRGRSLGGVDEARLQLDRLGVPARTDVQWLEDPSVRQVRQSLAALADARAIVAAIGSAGELATLPLLAPQTERAARLSVRHHRFARLVVGYPSSGYHALMPSPFMGYGGVVVLAQRLLDQLYGGLLVQ